MSSFKDILKELVTPSEGAFDLRTSNSVVHLPDGTFPYSVYLPFSNFLSFGWTFPSIYQAAILSINFFFVSVLCIFSTSLSRMHFFHYSVKTISLNKNLVQILPFPQITGHFSVSVIWLHHWRIFSCWFWFWFLISKFPLLWNPGIYIKWIFLWNLRYSSMLCLLIR